MNCCIGIQLVNTVNTGRNAIHVVISSAVQMSGVERGPKETYTILFLLIQITLRRDSSVITGMSMGSKTGNCWQGKFFSSPPCRNRH
jgi:hypothetical protein